ncbi:hypothetical protein [Lentibacillus sp.]|jgi:hypothetical protein|uniref:hypothetical protein n=1 Tax=Lentibacillus sp. TaxID=1925746 RepID=UPI002B4B8EFF|nr:hypothetical protein [Lentibacillus sp.]HLS10495.1 hypothetical protein [Lentibacillus sp.]
MEEMNMIRQGLYLQGFSVYEADTSYIHNILCTMNQAQASFTAFPHLNQEVPITIVDKALMRDE